VATLEDKEKHREQTLKKARQKIRRLVNANAGQWTSPNGQKAKPKFLTLTFKDNETDLKKANYEFMKFIQRLKYRYRLDVKYLAVVEFQKRGAIHYHLILFNMPYIDQLDALQAVWGHGFIKLKGIKEVDNVGAYLCKYLTKETAEKLKEEKSYFSSRGLHQPEVLKNDKKIDQLVAGLGSPRFEAEYSNEYIGITKYKQFNLNSQECVQKERKKVNEVK
jgi:hypothetical protein